MFYVASKTRIADVTDGLSNTVMGSENLVVPDNANIPDRRGQYNNADYASVLMSTDLPPNTPTGDTFDACIATSLAPCTASGYPTRLSTNFVMFARSAHSGGVNAVLGDASVRFVTNNITTATWQAACTRAGGEVPGSDF
jgi:hypothetical protein